MNEIEIKAKLRNREEVLEYIKKAGAELIDKKYQKDTAFWPNQIRDSEDGKKLLGVNYMRIRKQKSDKKGEKILFTLKQPQTNQADCIEHEIEIRSEDTATLESLIFTLGFYEFCTVEKNRETYKLGDMEICLDEVTDLGLYIELEKFGESSETSKIQAELSSLLESWGVKKEDQTTDGYDILMSEFKKA